jgi:hypothetical protein
MERQGNPKRKGHTVAKQTETVTSAGYDASAYEWDTVHEEAPDQISFDDIGDTYVGVYQGSELITFTNKKGEDLEFTQLRFRDVDGTKVTNAGFELRDAFSKIEPGTMVKVVLAKMVDVGQESHMKSFNVATARANNKG